ncbi:glyoxal oxidase N-terminus-domain-containing protein [Kalaharituber pfeilii]|nr:glyoxal oxidase N-terminus-domain-containing protein [Kalaharituber pfeilii]
MATLKIAFLVGFNFFSYAVTGNLLIPQPQVKCYEGCPEGKFCRNTDEYCQKPIWHPKHFPTVVRRQQLYSTDGRCGPNFSNTICDPKSSNYPGGCCSANGWCGNTADHCGVGCISGCTTTPPPPTTGGATTDGKCGRDNGGKTCVGWSTGECCSLYGWCGNTASHCGQGCQSGPCTGGNPGPGPGPGPQAPGPAPAPMNPNPGSFAIVGQSGVPAMHSGLLPNGRVVFLDKIENYTQVKLPNGRFAYSSEYDPATNQVVPLGYSTNAFCSGGTFLANGDFISLGGNSPLTWLDPTVGNGLDAIRYLSRSSTNSALNGQYWKEPGNKLSSPRWYPSAQILADGRVFVAAGSLNGLDPSHPPNNNPTYEILSPTGMSNGQSIPLDILVKNQPYYLYPFMHLLRNGQIFIFAAKSSVVFDIGSNTVVKTLPDLSGLYRTYPNTGGSVLLPLTYTNNWEANPTWEMDSMNEGRCMVEAVLLPDGKVLWINGANRGAQGFVLAENPTLQALLYDPARPLGERWSRLASSTIPRLYHSVALLLLDGTVMLAGSNPNEMPVLEPRPNAPYVTEFRVERYTPPYLSGANANRRPTNIVLPVKVLQPNMLFEVRFNAPSNAKDVRIVMYYGGYVTHSVHMGQRMMILERMDFKPNEIAQVVRAKVPPNKNICPPGPYVIYVVVDGVPGVGQFVQVT